MCAVFSVHMFGLSGCLPIGSPVGGSAAVLPLGKTRADWGVGWHYDRRESGQGEDYSQPTFDIHTLAAAGLGHRTDFRGGFSVDLWNAITYDDTDEDADHGYFRFFGALRFQILGNPEEFVPTAPLELSLEAGCSGALWDSSAYGSAQEGDVHLGLNLSVPSTFRQVSPYTHFS